MDSTAMEAAIEDLRSSIGNDVQAMLLKIDGHYLRLREQLQKSSEDQTRRLDEREARIARRERELDACEAATKNELPKHAGIPEKPQSTLFGSAKPVSQKENTTPNEVTKPASLFGGSGRVAPKSAERPTVPTNVSQPAPPRQMGLFGGYKAEPAPEKATALAPAASAPVAPAPAVPEQAPVSPSGVDRSAPGSASQLRAQFERRTSVPGPTAGARSIQRAKSESWSAQKKPAEPASPRSNAASVARRVQFEGEEAQAPQPAAATGTGFASASGSLFGGAVPRASGSLFGGGAGAVTTTTSDEGLASKATDIDRSDPGSASQLRAQFERRPSIDDDAARKSWAPKLSSVPLPNGGETRVHAGSDVGGAYKAKTSFNKPPPERKSFADLP
eukprot:TRINITY_DN27398_c0_g1_i2.p1 TRINITY_DN27398_c0_g1~~TRINITY_DN27398_c0_g1_i2.p1  ORF type:complete len:389 (-),score=92.02 TRINITY_DN27398_c0_g1_i2:155-1321(-)